MDTDQTTSQQLQQQQTPEALEMKDAPMEGGADAATTKSETTKTKDSAQTRINNTADSNTAMRDDNEDEEADEDDIALQEAKETKAKLEQIFGAKLEAIKTQIQQITDGLLLHYSFYFFFFFCSSFIGSAVAADDQKETFFLSWQQLALSFSDIVDLPIYICIMWNRGARGIQGQAPET